MNQVLANMSAKFLISCLCIVALLSLSFCVSQGQVDFEYAKCNEEDSCCNCYAELVRAVLGNDDNVFNLSKASSLQG